MKQIKFLVHHVVPQYIHYHYILLSYESIWIIWSLSLTWTVASSLRVIPWIPRQRKGLGSTSCGNINHKSRTFKHWELDSKLSSTSEQRDLQNLNFPISSTHASKAEGCKYDLSCMFIIAQVFYKIPLNQERLPGQLLDGTKSSHCPKRFAEEPRASLKLHGMYLRFMTPAHLLWQGPIMSTFAFVLAGFWVCRRVVVACMGRLPTAG